jgi:hypothetical protein
MIEQLETKGRPIPGVQPEGDYPQCHGCVSEPREIARQGTPSPARRPSRKRFSDEG